MKDKDFFDFGSKLVNANFLASAEGLKQDANGEWGHHKLIKGYYEEIDFPVIFRQTDGKKLTDILDTGWPSLYLISNRMKIILEENALTGWKTFPIKLYDKKNSEITEYHGFSVTGRCGQRDFSHSEIIEKQFAPNCPVVKYYKGFLITEWDGSDFFMPRNRCQQIVTKKTADVLKKNKITNIKLNNIANYEANVNDIAKFGP